MECWRIADVLGSEKPFGFRKLSTSFVTHGNRTQEADGSIPFSSTKARRFFFNFG
jgi:hypothetical protein